MGDGTTRPAADEFDPFYADYIGCVPDGSIDSVLEAQRQEVDELYGAIAEDRGDHRYAEGKWTIREVIGHVTDAERIFSYRAMRFARDDATELPGMDQDIFVAGAKFERLPVADLVAEFVHLRAANVLLFKGLSPEMFDRRGVASSCPFTVRALAYIIAGHCKHHIGVMRDRYL
jgi:hypothetical protein